MTINDIMVRDMAEAKKEERERAEAEAIGDRCSLPWLAVAILIAVALAALGAAFSAGIYYQSRRAEKAQEEFHAWLERVDRDATARARSMSGYELLKDTGFRWE